MSPEPAIQIPVDVTNPGQFFACCGLLELADRLWPGAEGWFEVGNRQTVFQIAASTAASLHKLLINSVVLQFDLGNDDDNENERPLDPIVVKSPITLVLDWWSDRSIKPWAGSMKERLILNAMLRSIDPANPDPLNDPKAVKPIYFRDQLIAAPLKPMAKQWTADCCSELRIVRGGRIARPPGSPAVRAAEHRWRPAAPGPRHLRPTPGEAP